ncbi:MAG: L,D-transpeptidase [Parachlamydiales bacterium]|nr:L,D-transpeptidase [Parachlamydiales bacterium]
MSFPKILFYISIFIFGLIFIFALVKKKTPKDVIVASPGTIQKIVIKDSSPQFVGEKVRVEENANNKNKLEAGSVKDALPEGNRIHQLFSLNSPLPIVQTITYSHRVPWLQDRPAWIADYATHYHTTRHFIARSLNGKPDYFTQKVSPGDRFNVLNNEREIEFYLLIDLSRLKMWFYALDKEDNARYLLKTYNIGAGRKDTNKASGHLTPIGKYKLGSKVAIYKSNTMGYFKDKKVPMIQIFGTRWIPFAEGVEDFSENPRGFGIHGAPWVEDPETHELKENAAVIGQYNSDGCVRLLADDIEELFAIIISRPTVVELVKDFYDAHLPGEEKNNEK